MRYGLALLGSALGLALPVAAQAQSVAAAAMSPAQAEAHKAACDALAAIVMPDQQIEPQTDRLVEGMLTQFFAQDPAMRQLETAYPGMRDALGAGMKPVLIAVAYRVMPRYRGELSALYQANLTTGEARSAAAFFSSPAMARLLGSLYANMDYRAVLGDLDPDKPVTASDVQADLRSASVKVAKTVSREDEAAIGAFMTSPLGRKLNAIRPQKLAIEAKWSNYTDPEAEKAIEQAVMQAIVGHVALTDPETAALMREELAKPAK
jgi:hypothetical protein